MKPHHVAKVQAYLQSKFNNNMIRLMRRPKADDSVEVMLDDEFVGLIYVDEDDEELSFQFVMTILDEDLPEI